MVETVAISLSSLSHQGRVYGLRTGFPRTFDLEQLPEYEDCDPVLAELAARYPDLISEGITIGKDVLNAAIIACQSKFTLEDALSMAVTAADKVARHEAVQAAVREGAGDVNSSIMLVGADAVIREFFANQEVIA